MNLKSNPLNDEERSIIYLSAKKMQAGGMSLKDISSSLNVNYGTLRSILSRAPDKVSVVVNFNYDIYVELIKMAKELDMPKDKLIESLFLSALKDGTVLDRLNEMSTRLDLLAKMVSQDMSILLNGLSDFIERGPKESDDDYFKRRTDFAIQSFKRANPLASEILKMHNISIGKKDE